MPMPFMWCHHYPGVYVTDVKTGEVHGKPSEDREAPVDSRLHTKTIRVILRESISHFGDAVHDAETRECLGYTTTGKYLDVDTLGRWFDDAPKLDVVENIRWLKVP